MKNFRMIKKSCGLATALVLATQPIFAQTEGVLEVSSDLLEEIAWDLLDKHEHLTLAEDLDMQGAVNYTVGDNGALESVVLSSSSAVLWQATGLTVSFDFKLAGVIKDYCAAGSQIVIDLKKTVVDLPLQYTPVKGLVTQFISARGHSAMALLIDGSEELKKLCPSLQAK